MVFILVVGFSYNLVFAEEFAFGLINGNLSKVLHQSIAFSGSWKEIKSVITYNDIGAYELSKIGKYAGRFYATPQFVEGHRKLFAEHNKISGYYLITEMPLLFDGFYKDFFSKCETVFKTQDGKIEAKVYNCVALWIKINGNEKTLITISI